MHLVIYTPWCLISWFKKKKKRKKNQLATLSAGPLLYDRLGDSSITQSVEVQKWYCIFYLAFKTLSDSYAHLVCFLSLLNGLWCVVKYGRQRDICTKSALKAALWGLMSESISGQLRWRRVQRQTGEKGEKNPKTAKCCVRPSLPNRWLSVWAFKGFYV